MASVPLDLLQPPPKRGWASSTDVWRLPDRDIHRMLVLRGPQTTTSIKNATRLATHVVWHALSRMERHGVVVSRRAAPLGIVWSVKAA